MPIPFILTGLGVVAGVLGAGGHLSAKETNEKAQRVMRNAQELYECAKESLEEAQNRTEKTLLRLGYAKKDILNSSMQQFLNSYDKIKQIQVEESVGYNEIANFSINQQDAVQLREMTDIYSSSIQSGATGAAAGAIIALAANGSLSIVTGGLATAGSALLAGEITAAAGIAGSALSFGAAMTPLAAIAAPVLLFTGLSASMKADENLEKANVMYAEAEKASEEMQVSETLCNAISDRSDMFYGLLMELNSKFAECSAILTGVVQKKEGRIFKKKLTSHDFTEDELKLIAVTRALAGAVKAVIDTPILSKNGSISKKSHSIYQQTVKKLPDFDTAFDEIKSMKYIGKPVKARPSKSSFKGNQTAASLTGASILQGARNIFAAAAGVVTATLFSGMLSGIITNENSKFLFLKALTANKIALWLLLCTSVIMLIGHVKESWIENLCKVGAGIGLSVLFVQYCRIVENKNHYVILSMVFLILFSGLNSFFDNKKGKWQFAEFFSLEAMCLAMYPVVFLFYTFFCDFLGFSKGICLLLSSVFMCYACIGEMTGTLTHSEGYE